MSEQATSSVAEAKKRVWKAMEALDEVKDNINSQVYITICEALKVNYEQCCKEEREARDPRPSVRAELEAEVADLQEMEASYGRMNDRFERRVRIREETVRRRTDQGWYTDN